MLQLITVTIYNLHQRIPKELRISAPRAFNKFQSLLFLL